MTLDLETGTACSRDLLVAADQASEILGPEGCMFGSNVPVDRPAVPYAHSRERLVDDTTGLSEFERDALFVTTAAAAYRIGLPGRTT